MDSIDGAVEAVGNLRAFDRAQVRSTFERRFSASAMAQDYVHLYALLAGQDDRGLRMRA